MLFGLAVMLMVPTWLLQPPMCSIRPTDLPFQAERALVTAYEECGSVAECLWLARQGKVPVLKSFGGERGGLTLQGVTETLGAGVALANV